MCKIYYLLYLVLTPLSYLLLPREPGDDVLQQGGESFWDVHRGERLATVGLAVFL